MDERKEKEIGFTVACVNEFAQQYNLSIQEAFRYLFQFKGIAFIKENYEVEHTFRFWNNNRRLRDIVPKKTEACYEIISWKYIVIDSINHVVELA